MDHIFQEIISFLLFHKVAILTICEITAWIFTVGMAITRYILKSKIGYVVTTIVAGITGWVPHFSYLIHDTIVYGFHLTIFDYVIILILILGITVMGKYHKAIDDYFRNLADKIANKKGLSQVE